MGRYATLSDGVRKIYLANNHLQGDNWNDLLKEVVTFDSVEEFWGVYVGLALLSKVHQH